MNGLFSKLTRLFKDDLLRHTAILFTGMMVVNGCNLVYQMAVSRVLPKNEYVLLMAFSGMLAMFSYPLSTLTTGLGHYSSLLYQEGRFGDVKRLVIKWLLLTSIPSLIFGAVTVIWSGNLAKFMHLDRIAPVVIAGSVIPAMFFLPILTGAAQGLQLFGWCSVSNIFGAVVRLVLGAGFVWFFHSSCGWAMLGHCSGIYGSAAVLIVGLILTLRSSEKSDVPLPSLRMYLVKSCFALMAFAVLMNADVVLVKHYLPHDDEFAYAATLGRTVAFLSMAVAMAMFPKVSSSKEITAKHRKIFLQSFGYTVIFVGAATLACFLIPHLLLNLLFGMDVVSESMVRLTRWMAVAMSLSALLNVVVQFLLAQRRFQETIVVMVSSVLYLLLAHLDHESAEQIAVAACIFNLIALLAGLFGVFRLNVMSSSGD